MNKRLSRSLRFLGLCAALTGGVFLLGFAERTADSTPVAAVRVHMLGGEGMHFVDEAAIERAVLDQGTAVVGAAIGTVDLPSIEKRLRAIPAVAQAEAYHTMDGVLHVKVRQRVPIVRVFSRDGSSFYIDSEGWTMPVGDAWTARVPVVTGHLSEPGVRDGVYNVLDAEDASLSRDIHRLMTFLRGDPLWGALIDQVVVDGDGAFELVPRVGGQRIVLGHPAAWSGEQTLAERFAKLRLFYLKGIPQTDWRRYARIDLRFADQIVCTERTTP